MMMVEFVPAAHVRAVTAAIAAARQRALDDRGVPPRAPAAAYWEETFEANAAAVLAVIPDVQLPPDRCVRYRYFGQRGRDLLVRPFVARISTDVDRIRQVLDWHPPPDALASGGAEGPTQDVELLYRHFSFPDTAIGAFNYWLAMQELWASGRWVHSHVIASADEWERIIGREGWEVLQPVQAYEPAVVQADGSARLAVLVESPLRRFHITLDQIDIGPEHRLRYSEPVLVASGPRGYVI